MLQLCDIWSAGSVRCYWRDDGCSGAQYNDCSPGHMWMASKVSDGKVLTPSFSAGGIEMAGACGNGYCSITYAVSVRCMSFGIAPSKDFHIR